jgi:hypothetical protein
MMVTENTKTDSVEVSNKIIISLILCARNDQYQGNSIWRLETALNYVAQNVFELGKEEQVEVIVADWGSEVPLRNALKLTPQAARIVSFLHIPPEIARVEQKDSPFPEVLALNAAARRAKGEYIGRIDQDTLVGKHFLKTWFWLYEKPRLLVPLEKALLLSNRRRISVRFTSLSPSFWAVDRYVRWFGKSLPIMNPLPPHLFYQSYVGIWLLHRDLWYECGGYDERFIYMDWQEVDMMLRLTKYTLVNLGELTDHDLYHLDHGPARIAWSAQRNRKCNPSRDVDNRPEEDYPNDEKWGLMRYHLEVLPYPIDQEETQNRILYPSLFKRLIFVFQVLISGVQIAWDKMLDSLESMGRSMRWSIFALSTWTNRARVVRETVSGRPLLSWPRLLLTRWMERRSYRS